MDFDAVVNELYGLEPGDFVRTRDARAKEARGAGDRELAAAIKGLRKPTTVAWLANQLARRDAAEVHALTALGDRLRAAMAAPSGPELRRLNAEQRRRVAGLVQTAHELVLQGRQAMTDETAQALTDTLYAAVADPAQGEALESGRLTEGLSPPGFGLMGDAVPAPASGDALPEQGSVPETPGKESARAARLERARRDAADAEDSLAEARRGLMHATADLERYSARARQAAERVEQLRADLTQAGRARDRAQQQEDTAQSAHDEADRAVRQAERALRTALTARDDAEREPQA